MPEEIIFIASLYAVKIDREGETRITFTVPASERTEALRVNPLIEKALRVSVSIEE